MHDAALQVQGAQKRLVSSTGRSPTVRELGQYLELEVEHVLDPRWRRPPLITRLSLQAPREGVESELEHSQIPSVQRMRIEAGLTIAGSTHSFPNATGTFSRLRFGQDLTQREIAERVRVLQMQVSRILRRAVSRIGELASLEV